MQKRSTRFIITVLLFGLILSGKSFSIQILNPNSIGTMIVGTRQDASQMPSSGIGPGILVNLKYNLSPSTFMSLGAGIGTVTDDFLKSENFKTTLLPSTELKFGLNLVNETKLIPMFYTGLHLFGFTNTVYTPSGTVTSDLAYDSGIMIGGGLEYQSTDKWTFYVGGDYRYVITADQKPSPQYWVAQTGIHFALDRPAKRMSNGYTQNKQGKSGTASNQKRKLTDEEKRRLLALYKKQKEQQEKEEAAEWLQQNEASQSTQTMSMKNPGEIKEVYTNIVTLEDNMDTQNRIIDNLSTRVKNNEKVLSNVARMVVGDYYQNEIKEKTNRPKISIVNFEESYQTALQKIRSKDYQNAIDLFTNLLVYDPNHKLASNCQYWIGEAYHGMGNYKEAIVAFNDVLEYQISYKLDDALLMKGLCHMKMGEQNSAKKYFEELIERFPQSEYINRARNYLVSL